MINSNKKNLYLIVFSFITIQYLFLNQKILLSAIVSHFLLIIDKLVYIK